MSRTVLPSVAFGVVVLSAGLLNGHRTERWAAWSDTPDFAARLKTVPVVLGDWQGVPEPINDSDSRQSQLTSHVSYRYRNALSGDKVSLLLVCGRAGPVSVHTPDVCYGGAGFEAVGKEFRKDILLKDGRLISVAAMRFKPPPTLNSSHIEVCWAWNGGQGWEAPQNPRWELARYRVLYKLYVVYDVATSAAEQSKDPSMSFMRIMLPELERALANQL